MDESNINISGFLERHQLPNSYQAIANQWFVQLAEDISLHYKSANKCLVIGINGAQGSGKSTLADLLVHLLESQYQLKALSLSLDDFYYTRAQRERLAEQVHPLLITRGVPGTHDTELAITTINQLVAQQIPVTIPRFNKAIDDRVPLSKAEQLTHAVDVVVLEGWCMGALPQGSSELDRAINDLEATEDPHVIWRQYVNSQLEQRYQDLFELVDTWIMLKAPSFDCVYQWRLEQEQKLKQALQNKNDREQKNVMDEQALHRFIKFYQRITEHNLNHLPPLVNYLYEMDMHRNIINLSINRSSRKRDTTDLAFQWLVYTDMDGSLLDHHNYRYDEAVPVLKMLEKHQIPLIPVSSKTSAELELFRDSIQNTHPFIVENGAAVFIPVGYFSKQPDDTVTMGKYWIKEFVQPRVHWQKLIDELRPQYGDEFQTFSEVGIDGIISLTGLNVHAAARAARRHYGEPVSWHGNGHLKQQFIEDIEAKGAQVLQGGRFMHISGDCDKGKALQWLTSIYQHFMPDKSMQTLAIGDSQNDKAMLEQADYALLIRSPVHPLPEIKRTHNVYVSEDTGPKGWAQGVSEIVDATLHPDSPALPRGNHG